MLPVALEADFGESAVVAACEVVGAEHGERCYTKIKIEKIVACGQIGSFAKLGLNKIK